jgi:hypothetical protein
MDSATTYVAVYEHHRRLALEEYERIHPGLPLAAREEAADNWARLMARADPRIRKVRHLRVVQ